MTCVRFCLTIVLSLGDTSRYTSRLANAFISEDDEFGPLGSRSYITQTEDQMYANKSSPLTGFSSPFQHSSQLGGGDAGGGGGGSGAGGNGGVDGDHPLDSFSPLHGLYGSPDRLIPLIPPITEDDYNFTLGENEGIADLFDDDAFMLQGLGDDDGTGRSNDPLVFGNDYGC